jgi:excisionase family DNA binding protein
MPTILDLPKLLTPRETAEILRVSEGTLAQWRHHKRYSLAFLRLGRAIRYRAEAVAEFLQRGEAR